MAKEIKCAHCNSRRLVLSNQKGIFTCKDCEGTTDINGNRMVARIVGTTLGALISGITLGLIPDEIQDQIADVAGDFIGDLLA